MPTYITPVIETDPEAYAEDAYAFLQSVFPGWSPADGALSTRQIQAVARILAVLGRLASAPPTSIFRYLGAKLFGIPPVDAAAAIGTTTWTMRDDAGYTIHAGTQVGISAAGDDLVPFVVLADVVVPPGSTATAAGEVTIIAVTPGAAASALGMAGTDVELIDLLDNVTAITLTDTTSGGVDAELDEDYLPRLVGKLQLLTPTPVLPAEFAAVARDEPGVDRALVIDLYNPFANEIETITVDATSGTFTLTFTGQTTGAIARNASAADVQTALEALSNIAPGDVIVTGGPLVTAAVTVEFAGAYDGTNVTQMTANSGSLSGGTHTATIATNRQGSQRTGNERMVAVFPVDADGAAVSDPTKTSLDARLQALREVNFVVNVDDPTFNDIDVTFVGVAFPGFDPADVQARAIAAVTAFLNPATWGLPRTGDQHVWVDQPIVRFQDLSAILNNVEGFDHWTTLTFAKHPASLATSDVTMTGPAALPRPLTINGTVT